MGHFTLLFCWFGCSKYCGIGAGVNSAAGSDVRIVPAFFVGNILPFKLLRIFYLTLRNYPAFFRKYFF